LYNTAGGSAEFSDIPIIVNPAPEGGLVTTFTPPFSSWQSGFANGAMVGFRSGRTPLLDFIAGIVGNIMTLDDDDASNLDAGGVLCCTQVAVFFSGSCYRAGGNDDHRRLLRRQSFFAGERRKGRLLGFVDASKLPDDARPPFQRPGTVVRSDLAIRL
jgi:hypothetical protein